MTKNKKRKSAIRRLAEATGHKYQGSFRAMQSRPPQPEGKWASTPAAVERLVAAGKQLAAYGMSGPIMVLMKDGRRLLGIELGSTGGNNAPEALSTGLWRYHGTFTLLDDSGHDQEINLLDVEQIGPAPSMRGRMVELLHERGLIVDEAGVSRFDDGALHDEHGEPLYLEDGTYIEDVEPDDIK